MNTPNQSDSVIYYEQTSRLKTPGMAQPNIVIINGLFRPEIQDGIELSSTSNSVVYRRTMVDEGELREALSGKKEFDQGSSITKYSKIGEIQINKDTPKNIQDLTAARIMELMGMLKNGDVNKKEAIAAISYIFDNAARIVTAQNLSASNKAPQAVPER